LRAGEIDVGFGVDVHEFDLVAEIGEHFRRGERAAIAALPGLREEPGARQENRNPQALVLRAHNRRRSKCRSCDAANKGAATDFDG
jgi:hypothetical protein